MHSSKAERDFALRMARAAGAMMVPFQTTNGDPHLALLGTGAGIVMGAADHLRREYPWMNVIGGDLPGGSGLAARVQTIDYITSAFPTVLLLWCSVAPADVYRVALEQRRYHIQQRCWLYVKGYGEENALEWSRMGFRLLNEPYASHPLGPHEYLQGLLLGHNEKQPRLEEDGD